MGAPPKIYSHLGSKQRMMDGKESQWWIGLLQLFMLIKIPGFLVRGACLGWACPAKDEEQCGRATPAMPRLVNQQTCYRRSPSPRKSTMVMDLSKTFSTSTYPMFGEPQVQIKVFPLLQEAMSVNAWHRYSLNRYYRIKRLHCSVAG